MTATTSGRRRLGHALLAILLAACGGGSKEKVHPATPQSVAEKVGESGAGLAAGYLTALEALEQSVSTSALRDGLAPVQAALGAMLGSPVALPADLALPRFPADELRAYLTDRVFTSANVEERDAGSVTYLLPASAVCPYDLPDGSHSLSPQVSAPLSPLCVSLVDGLGLRIRATEPSDAEVRFAFLVGDGRASPLTVTLGPDAVEAAVDLSGAGAWLRDLLASAGAGGSVDLTLSGTVTLRLQVNRRTAVGSDVTFSASLPAPIAFRLASQGEEVAFGCQARAPLFSLRVDRIDATVTTALDLGVTTLSMPWDDGSGQPTGKQVEVTLGGLTFTSTVREGQAGDFAATGFGFGEVRSQVSIGGERYLSLDLSPRRVEVRFRRDVQFPTRTIFGAPPGTTLTVYADTRLVGGVDPSFAGKGYDFVLDADSGLAELSPYAAGDQVTVKVVNGTFTLDDGARSLTVPAGQCLLRNPPAVTQTWVDDYSAGTCP